MQFLIAASLFASAAAQLVVYPNGAVAPFDPANAAATKEHFAALAEAGSIVNPYFTHAQGLVVPAPVVYGGYGLGLYGRKKRSADPQVLGADGLVTYPNGAVAPFDPNVALATAQHYAAKAAHGSWFPLAGAANVHPAAVPAYPYSVYGRKKRDADAQVLLAGAYPYAYGAYGYAGLPYALPFAPLVAHPNGAVVPLEPVEVVKARAEHLAAVAEAGRKKRDADADAQVLLGGAYPYAYGAYGYAGLPYALPFAPLVAHPNGAIVPLEPAAVVKARAEHLAAVAEAGRKKRDADADADAQVLLGGAYPYAYGAYGYAGLPYALPFAPLVAHPNGAVVPLEPLDVVKARAEHLAAVAEALAA